MKVKKKKPLQFLLTIALVFTVFLGYATIAQQPPQPLSPQGPPQAPIDGGVLLLAAAGIAYGIRKTIQKIRLQGDC